MTGRKPASYNSLTFQRLTYIGFTTTDIISGSSLSGAYGADSVNVAGVGSSNQTIEIVNYSPNSSPAQYDYDGVLGLGLKNLSNGMTYSLLRNALEYLGSESLIDWFHDRRAADAAFILRIGPNQRLRAYIRHELPAGPDHVYVWLHGRFLLFRSTSDSFSRQRAERHPQHRQKWWDPFARRLDRPSLGLEQRSQ